MARVSEIYKDFTVIYLAHGFTGIFTRVFMSKVGIVMGTLHTGEAILRACELQPRALFLRAPKDPGKKIQKLA